jgi:hypothetical protein
MGADRSTPASAVGLLRSPGHFQAVTSGSVGNPVWRDTEHACLGAVPVWRRARRFHPHFDARGSQSWIRVLPAGSRTVAEARSFLSGVLKELDAETDAFAATLLISEVANNAARHGKEPMVVIISVEGCGLRASVFDHGVGFDPGEQVSRSSGG